jgi:hypothetical protein
MLGGRNRAGFIVIWGALAAGQGLSQQATPQQGTQPPAQQQPAPNKPLKPNEVDPKGKPFDVPDPTVDPTKDPKNDITKDPTKDPDAVGKDKDKDATGADASGAGGVAPGDAPDYTGPAILSRGFALSRPAVPVNEPFRVFAGISAIYDSGILGAYVKDGKVQSTSSAGLDFNWGASMLKYRKRSIISFNYAGHYYEYFNSGAYGGQDHSLGAAYTTQLSPRISIGIRENAGLYSNIYSVLNSTTLQDVSLASATIVVAPNSEAFADRTYYATTSGTASYKLSERLSASINGAYFLVNRNSQFLANSRGYQTGGDIAYRITRRQTLGVYYSHSSFDFTKIFGQSGSDSVGMNYSISLDKTTDISIRAGGTRYYSQSLNTVTPNPLVQAVLGIQTGIEKFYIVGYSPDLTVTLNRKLRNSSIGASFAEGITPGNGLILTSRSQSESVFWNLPTFYRYAAQIGAGYSKLNGYADGNGSAGSYGSYYARASVSRPVTAIVASYFEFDYRQDGFGGTTFHQKQYRISLGLRWSPGQGPIKFW